MDTEVPLWDLPTLLGSPVSPRWPSPSRLRQKKPCFIFTWNMGASLFSETLKHEYFFFKLKIGAEPAPDPSDSLGCDCQSQPGSSCLSSIFTPKQWLQCSPVAPGAQHSTQCVCARMTQAESTGVIRLLTLGTAVVGRCNTLELLLPGCVPAVRGRGRQESSGGRLHSPSIPRQWNSEITGRSSGLHQHAIRM